MKDNSTSEAFEFREITKRFGPVLANDRVSFSVGRGTLHGIVGENGAGKSTIMKILYGMYPPDEGKVFVSGIERTMKSPGDAIRLGIGMVHQHFMLVPTLTVWENVILGHEPSRVLNQERIQHKLSQLIRDYGFSITADAVTESLSVGQQQQVEILKLLYHNAQILILDEPTAVLTPQEVELLFSRLTQLWKAGKTIVIITHKLKEILRLTQRVTIMRKARVVETIETATMNQSSLAEKIIGRQLVALPSQRSRPLSQTGISVNQLSATDRDRGSLNDISFEVKAGEILGVAGVEGNGQALLVECLAGVHKKYQGEILFHGRNLKQQSCYEMKQQDVAIIPADRHREAAVLGFSVAENYLLGHHRENRFSRWGWLSGNRIHQIVRKALSDFDVRPQSPDAHFSALSGGNQQKVIIAREFSPQTKIVIAAHPTRGVDIGAIEQIHQTLLRLKDNGAAILLVSSELEEILALSDRIVVLFNGKISGTVNRSAADEKTLGLWMTGGQT